MPKNRIRELRRESKLSLKQIADELGVHESTVSRWESGRTCIPDQHKQHLAEFFAVSVSFLMAWDEPNGNGDNAKRAA